MFDIYGCKVPDKVHEKVVQELKRSRHPICIASEFGLSPSDIYAIKTVEDMKRNSKKNWADS